MTHRTGMFALAVITGIAFSSLAVGDVKTAKASEVQAVQSLAPTGLVERVSDTLVGNLSKLQAKEISGWGAQVGVMLKGFVESVGDGVKMTTEEICRVSDTRVGKICTFVIVYKLIGTDLINTGRALLRTVCGVILLIIYCIFVYRFYKAFLFPSSTLDKIDGKIKTYTVNKSLADKIDSDYDGGGVSWFIFFFSIVVILGVGAIICSLI